jgi:GntR family transcriptional regulator/MocR family aminotransferase
MSLLLALSPDDPAPLHIQIRRAIREAIRGGSLAPNQRLPGVRVLAEQLDVNRLTVLKAIRSLARAGLLTTVRGKGVFVAADVDLPPALGAGTRPRIAAAGPFLEGLGLPADDGGELEGGIKGAMDDALDAGCLSFSAGFPPEELIPADTIRRRLGRLLRGGEAARMLGYGPIEGDPALIEQVIALLRQRGLELDADDRVVVTSGAQQGIALCLEALLSRGEALAMESPGYMGAISACRARRVPLVPVPVDGAGLNPERLEGSLRRQAIGALYTVPCFQNPTGVTMGLRRRRLIMALVRKHGLFVIEDDIYADLRLGGRRTPPLKSLAGGERVIYIGSLSKSLAPALRVGFLVARRELAEELIHLKGLTDVNTSALSQALVADLLRSGFYRRHLARLRRGYRLRRDAMVMALQRHLPAGARFTRPKGGMHLWVMLDRPLDTGRLLARCRRAGVAFSPGELFFCDGRHAGCFRLNYSSHPPDRIEEGVRRIAACIRAEEETTR